MMKIYAEFFNKEGKPFCGSDSVYMLDGRNSIKTMKEDIYRRANRLLYVKSNIGFYKIYKGERIQHGNQVLASGEIKQF